MSAVTRFLTFRNLEQLLAGVRDKAASGESQDVAAAMTEALKLCATARTVDAGVRLQLQGALLSLRDGHPDDAVEFLERTVDIGQRWASG